MGPGELGRASGKPGRPSCTVHHTCYTMYEDNLHQSFTGHQSNLLEYTAHQSSTVHVIRGMWQRRSRRSSAVGTSTINLGFKLSREPNDCHGHFSTHRRKDTVFLLILRLFFIYSYGPIWKYSKNFVAQFRQLCLSHAVGGTCTKCGWMWGGQLCIRARSNNQWFRPMARENHPRYEELVNG